MTTTVAVGTVINTLKPTMRSVQEVRVLGTQAAIFDRDESTDTKVSADKVQRVWSTLVHMREEDGTLGCSKHDLKDFKVWLKDPNFCRCINRDPMSALMWFVDTAIGAALNK